MNGSDDEVKGRHCLAFGWEEEASCLRIRGGVLDVDCGRCKEGGSRNDGKSVF